MPNNQNQYLPTDSLLLGFGTLLKTESKGTKP